MNANASPVVVTVYLWGLDRPATDTSRLRDVLSVEEIARAARFVRPMDRDRWAVSRAGLRLLLARELGEAPEALVFGQEPHGKPTLLHHEALSFNLSHSADVAALVVCRNVRVGVDVEDIRAVNDDEIAWALSPAECAELAGVAQGARMEAFFRFWTLKEAYMKGTGLGAALPLHDFCTSLSGPGLVSMKAKPGEAAQWKFAENSPRAGMRGAVAARTEGRPMTAEWRWVEPG